MIPAVLDHLWQSTVVVLGVALLMPAFKRASSAVRYGLWFAASLKFLVPFAALAALGKLLAPAVASPFGAAPAAVLIGKAAQPFSRVSLSQFPFAQSALPQAPLSSGPIAQAAAPAVVHAAPHLDLGLIFLAAWGLGSIAVLARWTVRSARVRAALRAATPLPWPAQMPVLASPFLLEPGLVGLLRPVLVVPETLPDHLGQAEIAAILAHEACHLRRRDNLTAAFHMLVEALFWFHPLVWWIGARLIEERERACDEAVIRAGHDRSAYARSLLESARLYLESPLSCVAGASGSNLKTRVEAIMTAPTSSPLSRSKKALLLAAGSFAFATPVAAGLLASPAGQQAVAAATAASSRALDIRAAGAQSSPDQGERAQTVPVTREKAVLAPAFSVAAIDARPLSLAQEVAAPRLDQTQVSAQPHSGTEEAVRRWILALETHQPDLAGMAPDVEQSARQQWPMAIQMFRGFGPLKSLRFDHSTADGEDAYLADFSHGQVQVIVAPLTADGKLARLAWGPIWRQADAAADPSKPLPPVGGMPAPLYRWGAAASPAPVSANAPAIQASQSAAASQEASSFVRSYSAFTPERELIARWTRPICLKIVGVPDDQGLAVGTRIREVARAVGAIVPDGACQGTNIQIGFTNDPQSMLDTVIKQDRRLLGDRTSGTGEDKAVSLPIQAWYYTNGIKYAQNRAPNPSGELKALVSDRALWDGASAGGLKTLAMMQNFNGQNVWGAPSPGTLVGPDPYPGPGADSRPDLTAARQFLNVFVIVDLRRTDGKTLAELSDYVAMLALAQPRTLGGCNVLPSITDMFASPCGGRPAPKAVTSADIAYLTALYTAAEGDHRRAAPQDYAPHGRSESVTEAMVAARMAKILATPRLASR